MSLRSVRASRVPSVPTVVAPSIDPQCQAIGRPSPDNQIRLYTQEECEGGMKGQWYPNGECLRKEGGSWSAMCAPLNFQVTRGPPSMPMMPAPGMPMPAPGMPMPMPAPGMPMPMPAPGMPMPAPGMPMPAPGMPMMPAPGMPMMPPPGTPMLPPGMMVNPEQVEKIGKVKNAAKSLKEILDLTSGKIERLRQVMNNAMTGGKRRSTKKAKKARKAKSSRRQKRTSK